MDELIVLVTKKETLKNLWVNFELGVDIGRNKKPKILIFGGISLQDMECPMKVIHAIKCSLPFFNQFLLKNRKWGKIRNGKSGGDSRFQY